MANAFQLAAESHDVLATAQESGSIFDSATDLITRGLPASFIAAGNELGNTVSTIGNWLAGDEAFKLTTNRDAIASYDSDLAKYYDDHQLGIDTVGFIASSIIPGTAGIKGVRIGQALVRNAVKEGTMGANIATAMGLRIPSQQSLVTKAIQAIGNEGRVFKYTDAEVVRALGAGIAQNALEGAAFTAAVNATMYKSPILENRSVKDLVTDVVTWGAIGGGLVGGLISGIGASAAIRRGLGKIDAEMMPWQITSRPAENLLESDKMLYKLQQIDSMPHISPEMPFAQRAGKTQAQSVATLENEIRGHINALTGGDEELTRMVFEDIKAGQFTDNVGKYLEATSIARITTTSAAERRMNEALRAVSGKGKLGLQATADEVDEALRYKVSYVNMYSKEISNERPPLMALGDKASPVVNGDTVQVGTKTYHHTNNPYKPYNIFGQDYMNVQSRYLWAESLPKWADDGSATVHWSDIPLLQKAQRDGLTRLKVIPESGAVDEAVILKTANEIEEFARQSQRIVGDKLLKAEALVQDFDTIIDKLKYYLGININVVEDSGAGYYGMFKRVFGKTARGQTVGGDAITMEKFANLKRPLMDMIRTLKHEEGHSIFQSLLDARGISRTNLDAAWPAMSKEVTRLSQLARPQLWRAKDPVSISYRTNWHEMMADSFSYLSKNPNLLSKYPEFEKFAGHLLRPLPQDIIDAALQRTLKPTAEEVAMIINADKAVVRGVVDDVSLYNARQAAVDFAKKNNLPDPRTAPNHMKIITTSSRMRGVDGNLLEGMTVIEQKMAEYRKRISATADNGLGEALPSAEGMRGAPIGTSTGASFIGFEGGNYGTWSSFFSYVGQRAHQLIKQAKEKTAEIFNPTLLKLANNQDAAIEWSVINEKMRGLPNRYFLADDGAALVYGKAPVIDDYINDVAFEKATAKYQESLAEAAEKGFPLRVELKSAEVRELAASHITRNTERRSTLQKVHSDNGYQDRFQEGVFYPIPRDPRNTPHYAFVVDESVNSTGHSKMIYAKDAETLEQMRNSIMTDTTLRDRGIRVLTKTESEEYYKSIGQYEFERTLSENYINTALARKGTSESLLPVTDPKQIVKDFLDWHQARDAALVRTLVEHKYAPEFAGFRAIADPSVQAAKSKFGYISPLAYAEKAVDNPAVNLMKMALDISKMDEYPLWNAVNKFADNAFSTLADKAGKLFYAAKNPDDLVSIQQSLENAGYKGPIVTEALYQASNATVPRGVLSGIVNKVNSLIATLALRADWMNSLNNTVGSTVLLGSETKAVIRAIQAGNKEAVGELASLMKVKVPGTDDYITSPAKLIARQIAKFHNDKAGREWYKQHGFISSILDQYDQTLDHISIALSRGENSAVQKAMDSMKGLGDSAEKWTGNKLAEEFNRYVAAGVMKDITDVAVKHGLMDEKSALSYINTFVNRTQGNYLASQRPVVFQGPIGQAIGLFQTYQFNLLQQIFRHIGDGNSRNVLTMMGLQASVYGLNGLPAFNAINTYLIGQAGGNLEHKTLYDSIFSLGGKEAGEWLLYGGLSNGLSLAHPDLKINMYSRGDINPRHVTLLPVDPAKTPIYQATERFFSNMKEAYTKVSMGADVWSTFLRGVEQNGISRPLSGMAQVLEAAGRDDKKLISMNQQGNMLMAHDMWSLSSLMRIAGAKPLDEAVVNDAVYRINTYNTADAARRKVLAEGIKQSIVGGKEPDEAQVAEFAEAYARTGGKQDKFAQWYAGLYKNATVSQAEQLRQKGNSPHAQMLQLLMNGGE